jgi:hypothetical protein
MGVDRVIGCSEVIFALLNVSTLPYCCKMSFFLVFWPIRERIGTRRGVKQFVMADHTANQRSGSVVSTI